MIVKKKKKKKKKKNFFFDLYSTIYLWSVQIFHCSIPYVNLTTIVIGLGEVMSATTTS